MPPTASSLPSPSSTPALDSFTFPSDDHHRNHPVSSGTEAAASPAAPDAGAALPSVSRALAVLDTHPDSLVSPGDDIEMEPVAGHRRRKSSLMSPVGHHGLSGNGQGSTRNSTAGSFSEQLPGPETTNAHGPAPFDHIDISRDSFSDADLHDDEETGLTAVERAQRSKQKRKNTRLDQRIAQEKTLTVDEQRAADKDVVRKLLVNCSLILLWYLFSLSISLYNKWMFDKDRLNFAFPLFTTSMHMLVQFTLACTVLYFVPSLRPQQKHKSDQGRSRHETEPTTTMTKMFYLTRVGPCGAATSLDIGFGNMSLKFISLTFYTMCKSSSLAFVLLFAFVFRLETPTWRLVAIITTMTAGVILMVFGEVEFHLGGFFLVISAAFFSGFRWGLTQLLLLRNPATSNPFSSIFFLSPVMFLTLFVMAVPVEGFGPLFQGLQMLSEEFGVLLTPVFLLFPGCIAFLMIASEFALLQRTSVVTLSIAGIFKEVLTISVASFIFEDKLTMVNFAGLLVTLVAIIAYNYIKISKMRSEARTKLHDEPEDSSYVASDFEIEDATEETAGLLHQPKVAEHASQRSEANTSPVTPMTDLRRGSNSFHE